MAHEDSEPSTKRRRTGRRCIVGGCSNENKHGFFMHRMPGKIPTTEEKFTPIQKRWITFVGRKRKFNYHDARGYSSIIVCSGHFTAADYKASDVMMYEQGLRTRPPALKNYAVPSIDLAHHPFQFYPSMLPSRPVIPSSAFSSSKSSSSSSTSTSASSCSVPSAVVPSATAPSATGAPSTLTSASASFAMVPSATSPQASAFSTSAPPLNTPSISAPSSSTILASAPSSSAASLPVLSPFMSFSVPPPRPPRSVILASSVTPVTTVVCVSTPTLTSLTSAIHTPQSSHRVSIYTRKKEVRQIIAVYEKEERKKAAKQQENERLQDILIRSQGVQYAAQMRNQKVGTPQRPRGRRSCKIQVKPLSADKGLQINLEKPAPNVPTVQVVHVSTQTITELRDSTIELSQGHDVVDHFHKM